LESNSTKLPDIREKLPAPVTYISKCFWENWSFWRSSLELEGKNLRSRPWTLNFSPIATGFSAKSLQTKNWRNLAFYPFSRGRKITHKNSIEKELEF
jgi:hypothetical protein